MSTPPKYWFKRRRYGWGWVPVTLPGWLVVIVFIVGALAGAFSVSDTPDNEFTPELGIFIAAVIAAALLLIAISYAKGPNPRWRWGKKPTDNPDEDW